MSNENNSSFFNSLRFRYSLGLAFFLVVAGYFLWQEHEAHILGNLPLLLILGACVGMHFFMHGDHGSHHDGSGKGDK